MNVDKISRLFAISNKKQKDSKLDLQSVNPQNATTSLIELAYPSIFDLRYGCNGAPIPDPLGSSKRTIHDRHHNFYSDDTAGTFPTSKSKSMRMRNEMVPLASSLEKDTNPVRGPVVTKGCW